MTDWLHKALKWLDYNRGLACSMLLAGLVAFWAFGCEATTLSLTKPEQVTRIEINREAVTGQAALAGERAALNARIKAFNANVTAAVADLDKQDELRLAALEFIQGVVTTVVPPPATSAVLGITNLLALALVGGAVYDNRRKDGTVEAAKNGTI